MKHSEVSVLRKVLYDKQKGVCTICNRSIPFTDAVVDHQHKRTKTENIGDKGAGLVNSMLCRFCNSAEASTLKAFRRRGLENQGLDFEVYLEGLLRHHRNKQYSEIIKGVKVYFVHPTEVPKAKILSKRNYGKVKTLFRKNPMNKAKFPEYPKSKKPTIKIIALFKHYNVELYN